LSVVGTRDHRDHGRACVLRAALHSLPSLRRAGMKKLVVNHLGKIIVTSDGATIVQELDVMHPAAKMIVLASQMQEQVHARAHPWHILRVWQVLLTPCVWARVERGVASSEMDCAWLSSSSSV
jgi:TCP-1/cpn60 chaperonin family